MKIALIGYGKMGKEIEKVARSRGHEIVCIIDIVCRELIHDFSQILIESGEDADSQAEIGRPEECFAPFRTELLDP